MSRDFDHIVREISKKQDDLYKSDNKISKEILSLNKDIDIIKREIKSISHKIDIMLELLNNFSLMILEESENYDDDDDDDEEDFGIYDSDSTWVPEEDNQDWNDEDYK